MSDIDEKLSKIRALLIERNLEAIVIRRNPNLAWLVGGRVHVPLTMDLACFTKSVASANSATQIIKNPTQRAAGIVS